MATKNGDGLTAAAFLVAEDPDKPTTWHLQVKDADGKPDHRLMGAAWASLHSGYRGNVYDGPQKDEALKKLIALYKSEGMDTPAVKSDDLDDDAEFKDDAPWDDQEQKAFAFTLDGGDLVDREFKGHVAVFGNVDRVGDVILPGAFKSVIEDFKANGHIYWNHQLDEPIGRPLEAYEDEKGLVVRGRISETQRGRDTLTLLRDGVVKTMSIGYRPQKPRFLTHAEGKSMFGETGYKSILESLPLNRARVRALIGFRELFDSSFVTIPANPQAKLLGIKSALPAGVTLEDQFSAVLAANEDLVGRFADVAELRFKAGRVFSAANVSKLQSLKDPLTAVLQQIDDLLDSVLPPDDDSQKAADIEAIEVKAALSAEMLRFELMRARRLGVPLT